MPSPSRIASALVVGVAALALFAAGCGGGDDAALDETTDSPAATEIEETETAETTDTETSAPASDGAAPAPGQGVLSLDDGRTYPIAIGECEFRENGTIEVKGASDEGSTFDMTQFQLGDEWRQTDASIKFANGDQIYVIVSSASPDGEPAEIAGKTITWEQVFRELDVSANSHVYEGAGTLRLSCP